MHCLEEGGVLFERVGPIECKLKEPAALMGKCNAPRRQRGVRDAARTSLLNERKGCVWWREGHDRRLTPSVNALLAKKRRGRTRRRLRGRTPRPHDRRGRR